MRKFKIFLFIEACLLTGALILGSLSTVVG